jgi:hypothetical protein
LQGLVVAYSPLQDGPLCSGRGPNSRRGVSAITSSIGREGSMTESRKNVDGKTVPIGKHWHAVRGKLWHLAPAAKDLLKPTQCVIYR